MAATRRVDVGALLIAALVAAAGAAAAGAGALNGDAAAYAAQGRACDVVDRWTHAGYALVACGLGGDPLALDLLAAASAGIVVLAASTLGPRPRTAAAAAAAAVLPWAAFAEVDLVWLALVTLAAAVRSELAAAAALGAAVTVSPAAALAAPWACLVRGRPHAAAGAVAAVLGLTAASGGAWWVGERGVLHAGPWLLGRTLGAWGAGLPWLVLPAALASRDPRWLALAPLLALPPDVPGWALGGVGVALAASRCDRRALRGLVAGAVAVGVAGLAARHARVREEAAVVTAVAAALGPDDGLVATWTWGARVAVERTGDPYGLRWRPPGGFLRDQAGAWCERVPARAAVLPPGPDGGLRWTTTGLDRGCPAAR